MTPHSLLEFFADARGMSRERRQQTDRCGRRVVHAGQRVSQADLQAVQGVRQRLGMAQALLHEPDVLILDEPTAGLDPNQIREVRRTMERLRDEEKKTILLSTHILQEVEAMASRVILINEGRLVYDGPVADLTHDGRDGLDGAFKRLTAAEAGSGLAAVAERDGQALGLDLTQIWLQTRLREVAMFLAIPRRTS